MVADRPPTPVLRQQRLQIYRSFRDESCLFWDSPTPLHIPPLVMAIP